ncbi:OmpA family protein [Vibrio agarivorans]|uniref:OmpA family protein n=1 Tax=Vibrio agarivorans TaxID=153622 RepID=A0ABT7XZI9_9VIBR|nr:OmpA family protein [Vibrio agarivorans]MDN2481198.1 OmpA family protein [Vibrio agarivorans]
MNLVLNKTFLTTLLILSITGCQATQRTNATTGQSETNAKTRGALVGALAGAAIGAATGDNSDAWRGAAIGGVVGLSAGHYMDKQEQALRAQLKNSGVQVKRTGENQLQLVMDNGIGFSSGSYHLESSIYSTLNGVAIILNEYPETRLEIIGHTDSQGDDRSNQTLSEQRADSVSRYLINQKIPNGRISTKGYGERYPLCENNSDSGRACNRRVEINILSLT